MTELTPRQIRSYVSLRILEPQIGRNRRFEFSFQDVVVLRAASDLRERNVPSVQIHGAMRSIAAHLEADETLTSLTLVAAGGRVVVVRGGEQWDAITGQEVMNLEIDDVSASASEVLSMASTFDETVVDAESWFLRGDQAESGDPAKAVNAYQRAIMADPSHVDARINLGRLLHGKGLIDEAIEHYSAAVAIDPDNAIAWFNMGVALEDAGDQRGAIDAYLKSVSGDSSLADAHHNLATLYEEAGDVTKALQHLREYRNLVK